MTTKPNPGCDMPPVKLPPSLSNFFADVQKKVLAAKAEAALINSNPIAKAAAVAKSKLAQVNKLQAQVTKRAEEIKKYENIISRYAALQTNCPLPRVLDKAATSQ